MILAVSLSRMLLATAGGGSFPVVTLLPPDDASWTRYGTVLSPTVAWEQTSIQEPDVHLEDGLWKMWAKAGWATTALGYYTATNPRGPWTPDASNPVLGGGGSSVADELSQPEIFKDAGTYYCYFNLLGDSDPNTPRYATGTDGTAWTLGGSGNYITNPGAITQWGNRKIWKEGASWFGIQEARVSGTWKMYGITSANGTSWTLGTLLSTLQPTAGDDFGGPYLYSSGPVGGTYYLFYHAGTGGTDLYTATSTVPMTDAWTIGNGGSPILTHTGTGDEADQVADPSVIVVGGTAYLFYAGVDNTGETGVIRLATAPAVR